jgi:hypothetical protein
MHYEMNSKIIKNLKINSRNFDKKLIFLIKNKLISYIIKFKSPGYVK